MKPRPLLLTLAVVLVLVVVAAWWWRSGPGVEPGVIDLIALFPDAEKRTTMTSLEDGFGIQTVTIDGDRRRSLFAHPFSRVTWTVTVPDRAVLHTAAALRPDAWASPTDGALFRVGISNGTTYTEFFKQFIQPHNQTADRRWFPIDVDLSAYAGKQVKVIFNTEPGPSGNAVGDACVWGEPRILPGAAGARP